MKKLIVALVALATVSAFAGTKSMINFDLGAYNSPANTTNPWFNYDKDGGATDDTTVMSLGFNYAYAVTANVQVQGLLAYQSRSVDESESSMTIGVGAYYNFNTDLTETKYAAVRFLSRSDSSDGPTGATFTDGAKWTQIQLEYGCRHKIGMLGGMTWAWNPHVLLNNVSENEDAGDQSDMELTVNVVNVAAFF